MIWLLNGRYIDSRQAKIPVNDLSILRGYGVFDFLVTYGRKPFMLNEHIDRLFNSAQLINLKIPYSKTKLKQAVLTTINKNKGKELTVRIVVTGGVSSSNIFPEGKSSVAIMVQPRKPYPAACYTKGIKLKTHEYLRYTPTAKHIDYLTAVVAKSKASKLGYLEVLYTYKGKVLECTTSNFYIIKNGVLITPKTDILHGITKQVVLKLAGKRLKIREKNVYVKNLPTADEVFISASDKEIMPVIQIDKQKAGSGLPGPDTKKLIAEFQQLTQIS